MECASKHNFLSIKRSRQFTLWKTQIFIRTIWMNTYALVHTMLWLSYIRCPHNKENFYYVDASPSPERNKFQSSVMRAYRRRRIAPPGTPLSSYHYTHYFCLFKRALIVCYYNLHQWLTSS